MRILSTIIIAMAVFASSYAAQIEVLRLKSKQLGKEVMTSIILPESYAEDTVNSYPELYLLHGAGGDHRYWEKAMPEIKAYADKYDIVIVCPDGGGYSWWVDSPVDPSSKYASFITKELTDSVRLTYRKVAGKRIKRAISGISMGGHGALYLAFNHPDVFGAAGSIAGGVDFRGFSDQWQLTSKFGPIETKKANWDNHVVLNQLDKLDGYELALTIDCGTDDFFYEVNKKLHQRLLKKNLKHDYAERPGGHTPSYFENSVKYQMIFFNDFFEDLLGR